MPVFETPESISITVDLAVGELRVAASDRSDTVVEVRPSDGADESDVEAAAQVRVDLTDGRLRVTGPKRLFDFSRKTRSVDVSVEVPTGSQLDAHLQMGEVRSTGRLGECRVRTTSHISVERSGPLRVHTGFGNITVGSVTGNAELSTGSGKIQAGQIDGAAEVKNSNGDTTLDAVTGALKIRNANGAVDVGRAGADADLKTSNGNVRVGEVVRGQVALGTAAGDLEIGVAPGTAAWLEVSTSFGKVRNEMDHATSPDEADQTVRIHGRTSYGDITVRRA